MVGSATWQRGTQHPTRERCAPTCSLVNADATATSWTLPLSVGQMAWVWQRWELEVAYREMNAGVGVGKNQCWNQRSAVVRGQWSVWISAVLLAGYRTWDGSVVPPDRNADGGGHSAGVSPPCGAAIGLPCGGRRNVGRSGRRPRTIG
ncbi:MAG: hypothetical protein WHS83_12635 [Chloroflexus sp.]|jgi:hypothetical protein|uniref:hypothetical protein n=1 Tax=Chloroflexus sp. TaxID=1904827 RepID=UPI00309840D9